MQSPKVEQASAASRLVNVEVAPPVWKDDVIRQKPVQPAIL